MKPASGALDLVSNTATGVKNSIVVDPEDALTKYRQKRVMYSYSQIIKPFNPIDAEIIRLLKTIDIEEQACFYVAKNGHYLDGFVVQSSDTLVACFEEGVIILAKQNGEIKSARFITKRECNKMDIKVVDGGLYMEYIHDKTTYKFCLHCNKETEKMSILKQFVAIYK
jgi:hypothetical protein